MQLSLDTQGTVLSLRVQTHGKSPPPVTAESARTEPRQAAFIRGPLQRPGTLLLPCVAVRAAILIACWLGVVCFVPDHLCVVRTSARTDWSSNGLFHAARNSCLHIHGAVQGGRDQSEKCRCEEVLDKACLGVRENNKQVSNTSKRHHIIENSDAM